MSNRFVHPLRVYAPAVVIFTIGNVGIAASASPPGTQPTDVKRCKIGDLGRSATWTRTGFGQHVQVLSLTGGRGIVVAAGNVAELLDVSTGESLSSAEVPKRIVSISGWQEGLLAVANDGNAYLYKETNQRRLELVTTVALPGITATVSPDGKHLFVGVPDSKAHRAQRWAVENAQPDITYTVPRRAELGCVGSLAVSNDGRFLAVSTPPRTCIFAAQSGELLRCTEVLRFAEEVSFSADSSTAATLSEQKAVVLRASSGEVIAELDHSPFVLTPGDQLRRCRLSTDGSMAITAAQSGCVFIWSAKSATVKLIVSTGEDCIADPKGVPPPVVCFSGEDAVVIYSPAAETLYCVPLRRIWAD